MILPAAPRRAFFLVQCFEDVHRWNVTVLVPTGTFDQRSRHTLIIENSAGNVHRLSLHYLDPQTLYAFFDRDREAVFQVVRWFTIFPKIRATIQPDFPAEPVTALFETYGAEEATRIPLARCSQL